MKGGRADRHPHSAAAASAAAGGLAFLAYAGTLGHGFVWDDPISVQRWLPALPRWWSAFAPPPDVPQFPPDYYRPLQLLSYQLDLAVGGGAPWSFHLTAVLLHVLATVLVHRTALRLFAERPSSAAAAFFAAALFAVHPIHTESVAWMAARPDVMVTCAGLAALLVSWHDAWGPWRRASLAAALVFAGLLCKENAAALLLLVPASAAVVRPAGPGAAPLDGRRGRRDPPAGTARPGLASLVAFAVAGGAYLLLRAAGAHGAFVGRVIPEAPLEAVIGASGTYLRLLVLPHPQNAYIAELPSGAASLAPCVLATAVFIALLWWAWRRGDRVLVFALAWIAVTLAPSLAVIAKPLVAPMAERYLYLPSVGFCWAVGAVAGRVYAASPRRARGMRLAAAALLLLALALTWRRNGVWYDNLSLWSDTAARASSDGLPLRNLAATMAERGDSATAESLFHEALARHNSRLGRQMIHNNLGAIALGRGDDEAAELHYRQALALGASADTLYNLGLLELQRALGVTPTAEDGTAAVAARTALSLFEQAIALNPHDAAAHVGLGYAADALGDTEGARRHFAAAIRLGLPATTEAEVRRLIAESP